MNEVPESNLLLEVRDVHKSYSLGRRTLEVLRGVDLLLHQGEFLALQGASGAGKSTLLHLMGGLDTPTSGRVEFQGRSLSDLGGTALDRFRNRRVGFVFQAYHLLPELDAIENAGAPARLARVPAAEAESRARYLLERVGLKDRMEHRPFELSGGEQQRVAIARALINSPELILADEPTGNLDSLTSEAIIQLLDELRGEMGATLVVATHDLDLASHAPRQTHLADGRITSDLPSPPPASPPHK